MPRIGFVSAGNLDRPGTRVESFRQALNEIGYTEGKNILVEYRHISGRTDQIPRLVTELVQQKVDVLVLRAQPSIRAAKQATKTIPIVVGRADTDMLLPNEPLSPRNRRISITLLRQVPQAGQVIR